MSAKTYTANGYTYTVYDNGTVTAKGTVSENPASRQGMSSIKPDGYDSKVDDKGHLIAAREGGVAADYNVSAQDRGLNRGGYKVAENAEVRLANKGYTVETEKTAYVSQPGTKPSAYMVNDTITTPGGKTYTVNSSFTNMSKSDMEKIDEDMKDVEMYDEYPNPDPLRESMTPEEYSQLMEETDEQLGSLKDEYNIDDTQSPQTDNQDATAPESTGNGVLDNDAEDFDGDTPSLDTTESGGVLDNDADSFEGEAPSCDDSVSFGNEGSASDEGSESGSDEGTDGGEGSDGGDGGEGVD